MPTIVFSAPSFNWHLTREQICDKALEKINELNVGETATSDQRRISLEALDGVLKMLQFQGLQFPKLSRGQAAFTILKNQQQNLLPADYYGSGSISYISQKANSDGSFPSVPAPEVPLSVIPTAIWNALPNKSATGEFPCLGWIDNTSILWVWPIPTQNIDCRLSYQKIIDDSRSGSSPSLRAPWALALPYGVAVEMGEEFGVSDEKMKRLEQKWAYYLGLCLMNEADDSPIAITVG